MKNFEDRVLDQEQWKVEAQAVINDIKDHVNDIGVSDKLCSTNRVIYMNLTTLEGLRFCIELSSVGLTIVGNQHDDFSIMENEHFETPYSLLNFVSPQYRNSFGNSLVNKLSALSQK